MQLLNQPKVDGYGAIGILEDNHCGKCLFTPIAILRKCLEVQQNTLLTRQIIFLYAGGWVIQLSPLVLLVIPTRLYQKKKFSKK